MKTVVAQTTSSNCKRDGCGFDLKQCIKLNTVQTRFKILKGIKKYSLGWSAIYFNKVKKNIDLGFFVYQPLQTFSENSLNRGIPYIKVIYSVCI